MVSTPTVRWPRSPVRPSTRRSATTGRITGRPPSATRTDHRRPVQNNNRRPTIIGRRKSTTRNQPLTPKSNTTTARNSRPTRNRTKVSACVRCLPAPRARGEARRARVTKRTILSRTSCWRSTLETTDWFDLTTFLAFSPALCYPHIEPVCFEYFRALL